MDTDPTPTAPPTNGTKYRLDNLETTVMRLSGEVASQGVALSALNTYLTGQGIKGSDGKIGEIALSLKSISEGMVALHADLKTEMTAVAQDEIQKARWKALTVSGKGFWALLLFLVALAGLIVTIVLRSSGH